MLDLITDFAAALYAAMTGFALSVQALAALLPWHASIVLSGVLAGLAALSTWGFVRVFRKQ